MTRPLNFPLLTDENIHPLVVEGLRERGFDVTTVVEKGLAGARDLVLLQTARDEGRVIVTHDSDFGTLATRQGEPISGIVYLRPGHIDPSFLLAMLDAISALDLDVEFPFLVVAARRGNDIRIRLRIPEVEEPE